MNLFWFFILRTTSIQLDNDQAYIILKVNIYIILVDILIYKQNKIIWEQKKVNQKIK